MQDMLNTIAAPVIEAAREDHRAEQNRYRAALNFAATCAPQHRNRARAALDQCRARHSAAFLAFDVLTGGPVDLSDPRD